MVAPQVTTERVTLTLGCLVRAAVEAEVLKASVRQGVEVDLSARTRGILTTTILVKITGDPREGHKFSVLPQSDGGTNQ